MLLVHKSQIIYNTILNYVGCKALLDIRIPSNTGNFSKIDR